MQPSNRDDVVSSFVRMKIREWRDGGRELQDLARAAGFSKSTPSQVLRGQGIGGKTAPGFAKAFGFRSVEEMQSAAWSWWQAEGKAGAELVAAPQTDAQKEAVEAILTLGQATQAQLETILVAYAHSRFRDRDRDWWMQTLLSETARDRADLKRDEEQRAEIAATHREIQATRTRGSAAKGERPPKRKAG